MLSQHKYKDLETDRFSLLPLAMQVAAQTVGLDLVPVVPMQGPMGVLTYLDFVYGGGRTTGAPASTAAPAAGGSAPDVVGFTPINQMFCYSNKCICTCYK